MKDNREVFSDKTWSGYRAYPLRPVQGSSTPNQVSPGFSMAYPA